MDGTEESKLRKEKMGLEMKIMKYEACFDLFEKAFKIPTKFSKNWDISKEFFIEDFNKEVTLGKLISTCGGFGKVYKGIWNQTQVAIKIINTPVYFTEIGSYLKESIFQKICSPHPNIVTIHKICLTPIEDFQTKEPLSCVKITIIMELLEGDLAKAFMVKNWTKNEIIRIFIGILEGLKLMHYNNLVHCDLKFQNILLDCNENPKICDFGITYALPSSGTSKGFLLGENMIRYIPLEYQQENKVSPKFDIQSLGVMLWESFSMKKAWFGLSNDEIIQKKKIPFFDFKGNQKTGDSKIDDLIEQCVSMNRVLRPSADEFIDLLKKI